MNDKIFMRKSCLIIVTAFLCVYSVYSQNPQFTASISKNPVAEGERFQVSFTLNKNGSGFQAPNFKGFTVLGGPSQSQSMNIINGQISNSLSFSFILQAGTAGKYTIYPASITIDGKKVSSNPIEVVVVKGNAPQGQQSQSEKSEAQQANDVIEPNLFIRLSVNKSEVYQGEQVIATYKLYKHPDLQLVNIEPPKMPVFNGFWAQDLEKVSQLSWENEVINGVRFQSAMLKKVVLLPQQTGKLVVDPIEMNCVVRLRVQKQSSRNRMEDMFFNDPFFGGGTKDFEFKAKTKTASLIVKPLPPGAPADFKGSVGQMGMKAWLDRTKAKTNEPVSLKIQISGSGNLKLLDPLSVKIPSDFDSFDPKIADNLTLNASGYTGNKTFEYLMIPRHSGTYEIEPVTFSYFDLTQKKYISLTSDKLTIEVEKGDGGESSQVISGVNKEEIKYLGKDIRFIKTNSANLLSKGKTFFGSILFISLVLLPLILFILFVILRRKQIAESKNLALLKNRRARKIAGKRFKTAKQFLNKNDRDKFYEELSKALWGYLSDKLGIPYAELTKDTAGMDLAARGIPGDKINRTLNTIDQLEFARFSPSRESGELNINYENAVSVIAEMEDSIK